MRRFLIYGVAATLALVLVVMASCSIPLRPYAPAVRDETGQKRAGAIATLEAVRLNGTRQWISMRGVRPDLPLLLYLAGGPCGSEMAWMRHYHAELERHFVVVHWDQRCAGKSYSAADWDRIAPADFVADAGALIDTLLARTGQSRLFLVGNSWGSMLGVRVAARWPEKLHAYVGVTQQVNIQENDSLGWALTLEAARRAGDVKDVTTLEGIGAPPYSREHFLRRYLTLIQKQNTYGGTPEANAAASGQLRVALTAPEFSVMDRLRWVWALKRGWETVYWRLSQEQLDFEREVTALDVPVTLLLGRRDLVVPPQLAERWLGRLRAPRKEIVWFERAGHTLMVSEAAVVDSVLISRLNDP